MSEGVPPPYGQKKQMVVSASLELVRLKPRQKSAYLGHLAHEVGWKDQAVMDTLDEKRKEKAKIQDRSERAAAHEATKAGRKEHREEN